MQNISDAAIKVAKALNCKFTLNGKSISFEKVFSESGLLPPIMRRADQISSFCLGYGLGVSFERDDNATTGIRVSFDDKVPISLRIMCITDIIIELMQAAPSASSTPLDELAQE